MTNELKDLVPAQEKLEWVTPKISLMGAENTEAKNDFKFEYTPKTTTVPASSPS